MSDESPQDETVQNEKPQINPGYTLFQMAKALIASEQHADEALRRRAQERVTKWMGVFQGILAGSLEVGSRTPLANTPEWVTLEVMTGGFASGGLLAGGPLREHERQLLAEFPVLANNEDRTLINAFYLSELGLARLREQLRTGHYEINVPEEGALLVVAWLLEQGHAEQARELLARIGPFFARLRFYPTPTDHPLPAGAQVFLENVGNTIRTLERIESSRAILAQQEAIAVWAPLYDDVARLFMETVAGDPPTLKVNADGKPLIDAKGRQVVAGGWPCSRYPEEWALRAQRVLDAYYQARQEHAINEKPERGSANFAQLREYLQQCVGAPLQIKARKVRWIRLLLARYIHKYGVPDSEEHRALRQQQARQIDIPLFREIAPLVVKRLTAYDRQGGLPDLAAVTQPITQEEAQQGQVKTQTAVPKLMQKKLERALVDSIESLVARGVISSGDVLALVLPQITAEIRAGGIVDPTLRQLYAALYRAFRRRRSLLLLNYASQVRIEELPWVAAIEQFRQENLSTRELAKETLEEVGALALISFPQAILPNKLLQELRALAKGAGLDIPFVDEVAADIFMGDFSPKFVEAAKRAVNLLEGTLYARYYGIDVEQVRQLPEIEKPPVHRWGEVDTSGNTFGALCARRAALPPVEGRWSVARNGMILEQEQILTTQNLAVLFDTFHLAERLHERLAGMARHCFEWICRRQQIRTDEWHARLIMVKNTAYAWRQMIFYLSFLSTAELQEFLTWAEEHLGRQQADFQARFRPALNGLVWVAGGRSLDTPGIDPQEARRFLGWSVARHWLLIDK